MDGVIDVNISILEQDAQVLQEKIEGIKAEVTRMRTITEELNKMWDGRAKAIFLFQLKKDNEELDELIKTTEKISRKIESAAEIYKKCETEVGQEVDSVHV